ncbi:NADP-dependent oxidoreductase domain-containing protein [Cercophora scortea]|uniref:NADP-dependent oxidoreductase domain-containing protein n=1 Tax=Cercophora scortea TaxID=314031 RepID=A0AAE0M2Y1_9PEZI|nr:NADP-dependent oxidoreductase domain-containing protein [Cercophora scortea]
MAPPASLPTKPLGKTRRQIPALGFGMMGLSAAYGPFGSDEERLALLDRAWELGYTNWDTASRYGDSEALIGKWFKLHPERRADIFLASKFGIKFSVTDKGEYIITADNSPEFFGQCLEGSLQKMGVDYIDLYYAHRLDPQVPVEKTMELLAKAKKDGKIKAIGISECASSSIRRAYAVAPVDAVQVEYNGFQLDIENETGTNLLATCRELGITVFAYAPLGRGFLTGQIKTTDDFAPDDFRRLVPRFSPENFSKNLVLVDRFKTFADKKGCTPGQLALAWLSAQGDDIIPIPGTKKINYLEENVGSVNVHLSKEEVQEIREEVEKAEVVGHRNPPGMFTDYSVTVEL